MLTAGCYGPTVEMLTEIQVVTPIERCWVNRPVAISGVLFWDDDPWMVTEGYGVFFGRITHGPDAWERKPPAWRPRSVRERSGEQE